MNWNLVKFIASFMRRSAVIWSEWWARMWLSPKDLFAAGYASCVIMSMDIAAKKSGFDIAGAKITVSPVWPDSEPLLEEVNAKVVLPRHFSDEQMDILRKGSHNCPIHNSLRPEVKTTLTFEAA